jgi:chorismate mutase/prephenate dehydratase
MPPPPAAPSSAWWVENSTEGVVTRSLDLFLHTPTACGGRDQPAGAPQPAAHEQFAGRDRGGAGPPAGAGPVPGWLSKHLPACRAPPGLQQCRRRAPGHHQPRWAALPASARPSSSACTSCARHPGRRLQPHPLCHHLPARTRCHARRLRQGLHQPDRVGAQPPGAVHDLLVPLKTHGVSMTRFESRPARTGQWEYYFYIDLDGHPAQPMWPRPWKSCAACARSTRCWEPTRLTCSMRGRTMF